MHSMSEHEMMTNSEHRTASFTLLWLPVTLNAHNENRMYRKTSGKRYGNRQIGNFDQLQMRMPSAKWSRTYLTMICLTPDLDDRVSKISTVETNMGILLVQK